MDEWFKKRYPTPSALGLDAKKYPEWRPSQIDAIVRTLESLEKVDVVGLDMPVGTGKTLVALAVARLYYLQMVKRTSEFGKDPLGVTILTGTKGLQDQYAHDAEGATFKIGDIRGMSNYPCIALNRKEFTPAILHSFNPERRYVATCDMGPCRAGVPCQYKMGGCVYYDELAKVRMKAIRVTNYAFQMTEVLGSCDLLIADEAHLIESAIDSSARVSHKDMPDTKDIRVVKQWANDRLTKLQGKEPTLQTIRDAKTYEKLAWIDDDDNWRLVEDQDGRSWMPIRLSKEGNILANSAPKIVLLSGTLSRHDIIRFRESVSRKFTWVLHEYPSQFPVENRRVFIYPLRWASANVNVNNRMTDNVTTALHEHIANIVEKMDPSNRKGIIHAVSYARARALEELLIKKGYKSLIYAPKNSKATIEAIKLFKAKPGGGILISPSVTTGFDFKYDHCRWQIIYKLPYPVVVNPIVKARIALDPNYGTAIALKTLAQAVGRGTRAADDWCETYVVDNSLSWALAIEGLAPQWLIDSTSRMTDLSFKQWLLMKKM